MVRTIVNTEKCFLIDCRCSHVYIEIIPNVRKFSQSDSSSAFKFRLLLNTLFQNSVVSVKFLSYRDRIQSEHRNYCRIILIYST